MRTLTRIPTTAQIRKLEADWIKKCGLNWGQVLMEIAGRGAAQEILRIWQGRPGLVAVVCGRGNNGGDGMVVARYLQLWDVPVKVITVAKDGGDEKMSTPEAQTNKDILQHLDVEIVVAGENVDDSLQDSTLIVDALFGTGLDRDVEGPFRKAIDSINRSGKTVVAIDIPSGVNSDTGKVMSVAVRADLTVTFGYLKPGLLCHPGAALVGQLTMVDIGLPAVGDDHPNIFLATSDYMRSLLPPRPTDSNKGTFGSVLAVAGSLGMSGATLLATSSALRSGAGLVLLATPKSLVANLPPGEVIYLPLPETTEQSIDVSAVDSLSDKLEKASAVILGPGISTNKQTVEFVHKFLKQSLADLNKPCIIDADALNAIAKEPDIFPKKSGGNFVLTPHPKELSRLMNSDVKEIQGDRVSAAIKAANRFNCTVVLKGSHTIVASPQGELFINPTGNPGMATAGAGDVLSGIIGGLMAQHVEPFESAVLGVYIHGLAGDLAAEELGETGVIAGDIERAIPYAIQAIEKGECSELEQQILGRDQGDDV